MSSEELVLRSPRQMLEAAKEHMLNGNEPANKADWGLVMNFFAANIARGCCESACQLLASIYNMPLTKKEVSMIVDFQVKQAERGE